mgnify:CR=1 FL=1
MNNKYFNSLKINNNISFGFFTRNGGYSKGNFNSLNCNKSSEDTKVKIIKNIKKAQNQLKLNSKFLKTVHQFHSNKVIVINKSNMYKNFKADGLITQERSISIAVLTADCCPIFLFDKDASFISCLHAGWRGAYKNIINGSLKKILKIQQDKKKINVVIGPCINKKNFEVENVFKNKFIKKDKNYKKFFSNSSNKDKSLFDIRALIKYQLLENGIKNIKNIDLDTYSNKNLFFSHRRSTHQNRLPTGRMINIIGFNS